MHTFVSSQTIADIIGEKQVDRKSMRHEKDKYNYCLIFVSCYWITGEIEYFIIC